MNICDRKKGAAALKFSIFSALLLFSAKITADAGYENEENNVFIIMIV